jgi:hypothetical protein
MENHIDKEFDNARLDNIRRFVDVELEKNGLYGKIKGLIDDNVDADEEILMNKIKEIGLIDEIIENFKNIGMEKTADANRKCLYIKLLQGKGFIDYLNFDDSYFVLDLLFLGQRIHSKKIHCSSEFIIDQSFLFDFNPMKLDVDIDLERIKRLSCSVHIVITLHNEDGIKLVGTKSLEWRWALCYGSWKIDAEVYSPTTTNKLNVGSLEVI